MATSNLPLNEDFNKSFSGLSESSSMAFLNIIKIGPWGGGEGHVFDFGRSSSHIAKVILHVGEIIDSLEIHYDADRNESKPLRAGGTGGRLRKFELLPNEYINSIVGSFNAFNGETCLTKLEFKTNFGKKHGPFGEGGGTEFTVPVVDGRVVGFFGRSNKYVNAIGVYVAP